MLFIPFKRHNWSSKWWLQSCGYQRSTMQLFLCNTHLPKQAPLQVLKGVYLTLLDWTQPQLDQIHSQQKPSPLSAGLCPWTLHPSFPQWWSMNICWVDDWTIKRLQNESGKSRIPSGVKRDYLNPNSQSYDWLCIWRGLIYCVPLTDNDNHPWRGLFHGSNQTVRHLIAW